MWVRRDEQEIKRWYETTQRDAKTHALLMASVVGILVTVFVANGWFFNSKAGIVAHQNRGNDRRRLPIVAALAVPFSFWLYRREKNKELAKALSRTVCSACGRVNANNPGMTCDCGGKFVPQSELKWIEG